LLNPLIRNTMMQNRLFIAALELLMLPVALALTPLRVAARPAAQALASERERIVSSLEIS